MKFLFAILLIICSPFLSKAQCPVIRTTMINACATFPSTSEGINEFVLFTTTAAATAGNYTLSYAGTSPPASNAAVNNLAGSNARPKNGTGTLTSTNGCTINMVTSPATVIPAGSSVIFIPSNFDADYDLTSVCTTGSLYVVLIDINAAPSNNWNPGGTFANSSGASPRYIQISNGGNNCNSAITSYAGIGWASNADGNSVWWDAAGNPTYENKGCNVIAPPKPTITPSAIAAVCEGSTSASMPFTSTGNPDKYSIDWNAAANAAGLADVSAAVLTSSPLTIALPATATAGTYTGSLTAIHSTPGVDTSLAQSISITINAAPVITTQPLTDTQRVCLNGTVTPYFITATAGSGSISSYQWFITVSSTSLLPFQTLPSYTPSSSNVGTMYFSCTVTNSNSCKTKSDLSGPFIVSPPLGTPTASVTAQPTCTVPTGTITVTAPTGTNILYSIGGAFQSSGTFTNLTPGTTYNITAKDTLTTCVSNIKTVTIDPVPAPPAAPTAAVTVHSNCTTPTATIAVTAPVGPSIQYSVGGAYQASGTFASLAPNTSFNITAKDTVTGCISNITTISTNAIPANPAAPTASVTVQPNCYTPTATVVVTAPVGPSIQYSIGGAYQLSDTFTNLAPGTSINITAKDTVTGCISNITTIVTNAVPSAPATPTASVTVTPTCISPVATIVVTAPVGPSIQYSNGGAYQLSGTFANLTPSTSYNITAKDTVTGCISNINVITTNALPATPAAPTASVTVQPSCYTATATIVVTAPVGPSIQFSIGGAYQLSGTFANLTPATSYNISAKDTVTGCISNITTISTDAIPANPAAPTASVTVQANCYTPTATIVVTTPVGSSIQYSIGGAYQLSGTFANLAPAASFNITAKDTVTGCISNISTISTNAVPAAPATPTATVTVQPSCTVPTATIVVTAPVSPGIQYSIGGAYQQSGTFTGLAPNSTFNITAKDTVTGCVSNIKTLTTDPVPVAPAAPLVAAAPIAYCQNATANALTATGINLTWYSQAVGGTGSASAPIPVTSSGSTNTYYVTQTVNGCESNRASITVTVTATPAIPTGILSPVTYCTSQTATQLSATGSNLVWYMVATGGTGTSAAPTPIITTAGSTDYYVCQSVNGCEGPRANIEVVVNNTPVAPVVTATPITYCLNATPVALTATGTNLTWYKGSISSSTDPTPVTTSAGNTIYHVTQTINGCESPKAAITVTVFPVTPQPVVTTPVIYCQNAASSALTATGSNLLWYSTITGATVLPGAPTPLTTTPGNSFYYVTQTINGCESSPRKAITVTVNAISTAVTGFRYNPDTICINGINTGPAYDFGFTNGGVFSATPAGLNINAGTGNITLTGSSVGTYIVTYNYNTSGCINGGSSTSRITINAAVPTITTFSYNSPACKNTPTVMPNTIAGFTSGGTFTASPAGLVINSSTGAINVAASNRGTYQITYTLTALGCRLAKSNNASIIIADTTVPVTGFSYSPANICIRSGSPSLVKTTGFTAGGTFSATPIGLKINASTGAINMNLSLPGTYTVTYSVPTLLCRVAGKSTTTLTISTYGSPVTGFSYNTPVCKDAPSLIPIPVAGFVTGGTYSCTNNALILNPQTGIVNPALSSPGNYVIRYDVAQSTCNTAGSGTANIEILSKPVAPAVTPAGICGGGNITLNASAAGTIKWYTDAALSNLVNTGNSFNTIIQNTTLYYLTNTVGSCTSDTSVLTAAVSPAPAPPYLGADTTICSGTTLTLDAGNYISYQWQDGSVQPTFTVSNTGTYKVTVSTGTGCHTSSSIRINVLNNCDDIYFPNAFSPDGNGTNDRFGPLGNLFIVKNYSLKIFNRYGEVVFSSSNPYEKWDGTIRGKNAGVSNYVWVASYIYNNKINKIQKGNLTLVK